MEILGSLKKIASAFPAAHVVMNQVETILLFIGFNDSHLPGYRDKHETITYISDVGNIC